METDMEEFVRKIEEFARKQNVERYQRIIESVSEDGSLIGETRLQTILTLLAEEQQKQKDAGDRS
jgi:hypothetical protein